MQRRTRCFSFAVRRPPFFRAAFLAARSATRARSTPLACGVWVITPYLPDQLLDEVAGAHAADRQDLTAAQDVAVHLSGGIAELGPYRLISEGRELPVFSFTLDPEVRNYDVFDVSDRLRQHGWLVPAYTFPQNRQDLSVLRIVVRSGMSHEMAYQLLDNLQDETKFLQSLDTPLPGLKREAFRH